MPGPDIVSMTPTEGWGGGGLLRGARGTPGRGWLKQRKCDDLWTSLNYNNY